MQYAVEGMHVITVEGIGNARDGLHPVQERLSKAHGSQCGFCTPGFVMSMYSLLRNTRGSPTELQIEECLAGNLCRCTGYRPILDAFKGFAQPSATSYTRETIRSDGGLECANGHIKEAKGESGAMENGKLEASGVQICPTTGQPCSCTKPGPLCATSVKNGVEEGLMSSKEPIFPVELRKHVPASLALPGTTSTWHRPVTMPELLGLKAQHPSAKLVGGNTEVGIEMKFKHADYPVLIAVTHVPELKKMEVEDDGVRVGASCTLTQIYQLLSGLADEIPKYKLSAFEAICGQLRWFAGHQIRNVATLGGNIVTGSPISDLNPVLIASGAVFSIAAESSVDRKVPARAFFLGYRKVDLKPSEVLVDIFIPFTRRQEYVREFKQAHRREDDIAIVTAGMRVWLSDDFVVKEAGISYGGVAAKTVTASKVEQALVGCLWGKEAMKMALDAVKEEVCVPVGAPGGMAEFRNSLAASFLFKFFMRVSYDLEADSPAFKHTFGQDCQSAVEEFDRPPSCGTQYFAEPTSEFDIVGKPERHRSADVQVSGEAQYTDDIPVSGCLHAALVTSSKPHALIVSVDPSDALLVPGVHGYFDHKHVPGNNMWGPILHDEELFATEIVTCVGQVIGVIVGETQAIAQRAARLVSVEYDELPAILSIADAIEAESFFPSYRGQIDCGDVDKAFLDCDHEISGEFECGGQEHFYLEPQTCVVLPQENEELLMYASTQALYHHAETVAETLGIPINKVVCKTKRIGGGFGGKETRSEFLNAVTAVAAWSLRKPVRLCLDRDEDMKITGQRHAFIAKYRVGFNKDGRIIAVDLKCYSNAGNSLDLSPPIMDRCLSHSDCTYRIPNMRARGFLCKMNIPSNTAFRGFGGPQGMLFADMWLDRVALSLGKRPEEIREVNMYCEGELTHFGQPLESCQIRSCWEEVLSRSDYEMRKAKVQEFNSNSRFKKRGIAVTTTKFGIAFTLYLMNQAGALVHVYTDGSVLVTHGGVEMGQGLHTKMCQVAAQALGVPFETVHISETSTDKVANASPSAASQSSDLYGGAVMDACKQIADRLAPYRSQSPDAPFVEIVKKAYADRVDLSAHGFFITPDVTGWGGKRPFNYFCYGAACSEVELDVLTGDWHILRTDIVMDVGNPLNPAIDIGQVEGGFVQGMGWLCLEELVWGDKANAWVRPGHLQTCGPGTYKIPTANDIPIDFRVSLLRNAANPRAVHSSKAVGEPPFYLSASAFFALKDACYSARRAAGLEGWFDLKAPATPERLRLACGRTDVESLKEEL
ncbi:unnamed protein product [Ostreobium quekettii]|uniref:xanthine dehydrogenase n=1 Tax=Ostreobium quekettii TaxID=121088 RepID=A0A8S1J0F5_9CHLO|nr:unnamed protein product [Ostreobium quekettii]